MVTKPRLLFGCYAACVIIFFGIIAVQDYLSPKGLQPDAVIQKINESRAWMDSLWFGVISFPGALLAAFTVGVHSDHFILAASLADIAFYLLIPYLVWKWMASMKKKRAVNRDKL